MSTTPETSIVTHDDLIVLTRWMATGWPGFDAVEIADAVEKPHKWANDIPMVRAANAHMVEHPDHAVGMADDGTWCCEPTGRACPWPATGDEPA